MTPKNKTLEFIIEGILSIDDQIKYIEKLPVCEETKAVLNSLEVAKSHVSQFPEKSIVIALPTDKAQSWNHWDIERHKLLDEIKQLENLLNERAQKHNDEIDRLNVSNLELRDKIAELEAKLIDIYLLND